MLANAATGPIWAKLSDIWGRKMIYLIGIALLAGSSIIAALSVNMAMLIAARALQGVASGCLIQLCMIIISDMFSVRERSLYMGYTGFVWAVAGSAGPLVGGAFTQAVTWRWCFWINLPICGITFLLSVIYLDVNNPRTKLAAGLRAVDWLGSLLILGITTMVLLGLTMGGAVYPWRSATVICLIVFGILLIPVFLFAEHRLAKYPLIPLGVFTNLSNNAVFTVVFTHGMVLIGIEYYMPLYFQSVQQASPIRSGLLLLPLIVVQAIIEIVSGYAINHTGNYRAFIWSGCILMALGTGLYIIFDADTTVGVIVGLQIIGAFGPALLFQAPVVAIQNTVSQADTAAASGALFFLRSVAMSLSVVLGGVVFQNSITSRHSKLAEAGLSQSVLDALSGSDASANIGIPQTLDDPKQRHAVLEAFAFSMRNVFILYTAIAVVGAVACLFIKHKELNTEHTETKTGIENMTKSKRGKD